MKKIIFTCFAVINIFAQQNTGSIVYKQLQPVEKKIVTDNAQIRDAIEQFTKASLKIDFTLNFNTNEAYFFANRILLGDKLDLIFTGLATSNYGQYKYYQNKQLNENRELIDGSRTGILVVNRKQKYDWTVTTESKMIGEYRCFKATSPLYKEDGNKSNYMSGAVEAWFAPAITVPFGPCGYGDLPGLILELRFPDIVYGATTITLNPIKVPLIDKLLEPKAISNTEYMEILLSGRSKAIRDVIKNGK